MSSDVVRRIVAAVVEHATEHERVDGTPRKHSAGHTHEYAQHDDGYPLMAFHDDKSTDKF